MTRIDAVYNMSENLNPEVTEAILSKAEAYSSEIKISFEDKTILLGSLIGVLSLKLKKGASVTITAEGADEQEAVKGVKALLEEPYGK